MEVEIEDIDEVATLTETDIVEIQTKLIEDLQEMVVKDKEKHEKLLKLGEHVLDEQTRLRTRLSEEFGDFLNRSKRSLTRNFETADGNVYSFEKNLRELLHLYITVHNRVKQDEKEVAKQDEFLNQIDRNEMELKDLRDNIRSLRSELTVDVGPVSSVTSKTSGIEANFIVKPYKPLETELATQIVRVNRELEILKMQLPNCDHFPNLMNPVQKLGEKVTGMVMKDLPAKKLQDFLDTLPPMKRD
ncbi:Coiled-coil domain-containing protein 96 [Caenorhabditis elegans]|uniref:Coiled-coil domain-containing protein 96 n=1 Tax=Caenorhabditis elegans TaxID=6239 RepID=O76621_CAEEL|nr:Coiled-coil domain-containing protein 96 [Caenorhabditis elegans]CCD71446.1 Coiled-coil domain-containing protein 96 [Caenorhabditis elegans]|eukprot:NP_493937.1 Uncharacterized protein CELE_Y57G7A.5 [Caenorhabditis elegans]